MLKRHPDTPKLTAGEGQITLTKSGPTTTSFSELAFSYPLKLIVPSRNFHDGVGAVYVISYGGGLVAGDRVKLSVEVKDGSSLVMLTQGSTKVFKQRPGQWLTASVQPDDDDHDDGGGGGINPLRRASTRQLLDATVQPLSTLLLLPSPVTCFSKANYSQHQVFRLTDSTASLVLLDWYTSGRMGMDEREEWGFERYRSENEVWVAGKRVARDVLLLEDEGRDTRRAEDPTTTTITSYASRVDPYSCYATLLLFGPKTAKIRHHLESAFTSITQYKQNRPYSMLWSYSSLERGTGGIARCAGDGTEAVKEWIVEVLQDGGVEELVGEDLWKQAFS